MLSLIACVEMSHFIKSDRKPQNVLNKAILHDLICFAKRRFLATLWRIDWKGKVGPPDQDEVIARATLEGMVAGTMVMAKGVREGNRAQHEY